jgi:hypothetical protein
LSVEDRAAIAQSDYLIKMRSEPFCHELGQRDADNRSTRAMVKSLKIEKSESSQEVIGPEHTTELAPRLLIPLFLMETKRPHPWPSRAGL